MRFGLFDVAGIWRRNTEIFSKQALLNLTHILTYLTISIFNQASSVVVSMEMNAFKLYT